MKEGILTAYRINMQAIGQAGQAQGIAEYLQVIPGFYAIEPPREIDHGRACIDISIVVREEVQEGTLLDTAEERVGQYLWQRPDFQPVEVKALAQEPLPEEEAQQVPPEHILPRRSL
jgi:hypothetical protein